MRYPLRLKRVKFPNDKARAISIDGETTDINDIIINDQKLGEQVIYNLNGQRLNNSERGGLYIINGKKVVR